VFDHVTIRVADRDASERFYAAVLSPLRIERSHSGPEFVEWDVFSLAAADAEHPPTTNLHIGFAGPSRPEVDAFWRTGVEAGHPDDGEPGPRPQYREDYYGSFLRDPDDNSAEAVHHGVTHRRRVIDHLWLRVADVAAARAFYETIAPHAGFDIRVHGPDHVQCASATGSFSLVAGDRPTENAHIAFPARTDAAVDAFHAAAVGAGYRDNGAPGERPQYHPGYYAAYVLDPDGNNVEVVNHHRR
jgi:catechol 2,3-dioxygenase-like lactoylglutathione lyase family enzyme